tara:strand:- start:15378 stop:16331 length:954 start_codon:yes stop_codon:yes gene_type:complete
MNLIVVPDDFPSVVSGTQIEEKLNEIAETKIFCSKPENDEQLIERVQDADAIINIRAFCKFDKTFFQKVNNLKIISIWGTGTDHVDLNAAKQKNVAITNTPGVAAISVAEHTITLMLSAARRINENDNAIRSGDWPRGEMIQLNGKTIGIIGLGAIGKQTAILAKGIGMNVIAWTFNPDREFTEKMGIKLVELNELYKKSDVISLHIRQSPETLNFINKETIEKMKKTAIIVNTARGPIINEKDLVKALKDGRISSAGLDVFENEPLSIPNDFSELKNVVLSPHNAGITPEVTKAGLELTVKNVEQFFKGVKQNLVC